MGNGNTGKTRAVHPENEETVWMGAVGMNIDGEGLDWDGTGT